MFPSRSDSGSEVRGPATGIVVAMAASLRLPADTVKQKFRPPTRPRFKHFESKMLNVTLILSESSHDSGPKTAAVSRSVVLRAGLRLLGLDLSRHQDRGGENPGGDDGRQPFPDLGSADARAVRADRAHHQAFETRFCASR